MISSKTTKGCWQWTIKMLKTTDFRSVSTKFAKTSKAYRSSKTKSTKASNSSLKASKTLSISSSTECNLTTDGERSTSRARLRELTSFIETSKTSTNSRAHKWTNTTRWLATDLCRQKLTRLVKKFNRLHLVTRSRFQHLGNHHLNNISRTWTTRDLLIGPSRSNTMRVVKRWEETAKIVKTIMLRRTMFCSTRMITSWVTINMVKTKLGELEEIGKRYSSKMQHLEAKSEVVFLT